MLILRRLFLLHLLFVALFVFIFASILSDLTIEDLTKELFCAQVHQVQRAEHLPFLIQIEMERSWEWAPLL